MGYDPNNQEIISNISEFEYLERIRTRNEYFVPQIMEKNMIIPDILKTNTHFYYLKNSILELLPLITFIFKYIIICYHNSNNRKAKQFFESKKNEKSKKRLKNDELGVESTYSCEHFPTLPFVWYIMIAICLSVPLSTHCKSINHKNTEIISKNKDSHNSLSYGKLFEKLEKSGNKNETKLETIPRKNTEYESERSKRNIYPANGWSLDQFNNVVNQQSNSPEQGLDKIMNGLGIDKDNIIDQKNTIMKEIVKQLENNEKDYKELKQKLKNLGKNGSIKVSQLKKWIQEKSEENKLLKQDVNLLNNITKFVTELEAVKYLAKKGLLGRSANSNNDYSTSQRDDLYSNYYNDPNNWYNYQNFQNMPQSPSYQYNDISQSPYSRNYINNYGTSYDSSLPSIWQNYWEDIKSYAFPWYTRNDQNYDYSKNQYYMGDSDSTNKYNIESNYNEAQSKNEIYTKPIFDSKKYASTNNFKNMINIPKTKYYRDPYDLSQVKDLSSSHSTIKSDHSDKNSRHGEKSSKKLKKENDSMEHQTSIPSTNQYQNLQNNAFSNDIDPYAQRIPWTNQNSQRSTQFDIPYGFQSSTYNYNQQTPYLNNYANFQNGNYYGQMSNAFQPPYNSYYYSNPYPYNDISQQLTSRAELAYPQNNIDFLTYPYTNSNPSTTNENLKPRIYSPFGVVKNKMKKDDGTKNEIEDESDHKKYVDDTGEIDLTKYFENKKNNSENGTENAVTKSFSKSQKDVKNFDTLKAIKALNYIQEKIGLDEKAILGLILNLKKVANDDMNIKKHKLQDQILEYKRDSISNPSHQQSMKRSQIDKTQSSFNQAQETLWLIKEIEWIVTRLEAAKYAAFNRIITGK